MAFIKGVIRTEDRNIFLSFFVNTIKQQLNSLKESLENTDPNKFEIDAYKDLKRLNDAEKTAIYRVVYDILETYTHSIMVMFDNGTSLSDKFLIDVINYDTKRSLTENYDAELHDDFMGLMLDKFES